MYLQALCNSPPSLRSVFQQPRVKGGERRASKRFLWKSTPLHLCHLIKLSSRRDLEAFRRKPVKTIEQCVTRSSGLASLSSNWCHLINPQAQPGPISKLLFLEINYLFRQGSGGGALKDFFGVCPSPAYWGGSRILVQPVCAKGRGRSRKVKAKGPGFGGALCCPRPSVSYLSQGLSVVRLQM